MLPLQHRDTQLERLRRQQLVVVGSQGPPIARPEPLLLSQPLPLPPATVGMRGHPLPPIARIAPPGLLPPLATAGARTGSLTDLSSRRVEDCFVLLAKTRAGAIDGRLLLALLQMLGLRLSENEVSVLLLARGGIISDVYDLVDVLGLIDVLCSAEPYPGLPRPPPFTRRYAGAQPFARVDPLLLLNVAAVNGRLLRTQAPRMGTRGATSEGTQQPADPSASDVRLAGMASLSEAAVEPLPQLPALSADEQTRLHMALLLHVYSNKPANSVEALLRIYALAAAAALALSARAVYGPRDGCGRPLGTYLLFQGSLLLAAAALQLVAAARAANRNPLQLMRLPLDTSGCAFAIDGVRVLLLCPALLVCTLLGAVWTFSLRARSGALLCDGSPVLFAGSCAALAYTVVHGAIWLAAVAARTAALRSSKELRQAAADEEEQALASWLEGAPGTEVLGAPSPRQRPRRSPRKERAVRPAMTR